MKKTITFDTHEVVDRKTLRYVYSSIFRLLVHNKEKNSVGLYSNGKNDAYVEVIRIINDILDA